jgi:DNA replication protein DnaC
MSQLLGDRRKWKLCEECGFEWPPFGDRAMKCPVCFPPPMPEREMRGKHDALLASLERAGVNVHQYQHATLESFDPNPDLHALDLAKRWMSDYTAVMNSRWPKHEWVYFYGSGSEVGRLGGMGNGKTHLGIAVARALIETQRLGAGQYRFVTAEGLLLEMEGTFRSKSEESEARLLRQYEQYRLLHIDDFGVREPSPHALRILDELTKRREGRATIWTSNLSLKVVAKTMPELQRIASRIAGMCGEGARYAIRFEGPDRRVERSRQSR